jgi:1-deoxy-D-xylulose-5-phosphate reductoisomerase
MSQKRIAIFGSTGSIGKQTLEVIAANPDLFVAEILTAHANESLLIEQALLFEPNIVVIGEIGKYAIVKKALEGKPIKVFAGEEALEQVAGMDCYDFMMAGIVGFAGLKPTLTAVQNGKAVGLANKETLVVAGDIVMRTAREKGAAIIPVDSEHSAIFQCLVGEGNNPIEKIILTASGGPFLGKKPNFLVNVKRDHALQHPNWSMGAKISIDSATLMNKGLEMIEAKWLFDLRPDQIKVVVHAQSIIHSMVQFEDGSIKAQMGLPDMKLPIQFALGYPNRIKSDFPRFDFRQFGSLTFEQADVDTFRNLGFAFKALDQGGNMACILNAANEIAVDAFLKEQIGFLQMSDLLEQCMSHGTFLGQPTLEDYIETDLVTRKMAQNWVEKNNKK